MSWVAEVLFFPEVSKCLGDIMSGWQNVSATQCPGGKMSRLQNVRVSKCLSVKMSKCRNVEVSKVGRLQNVRCRNVGEPPPLPRQLTDLSSVLGELVTRGFPQPRYEVIGSPARSTFSITPATVVRLQPGEEL